MTTDSAHLVDPELREFLELWPIRSLSETTLETARAIIDKVVEDNRLNPATSDVAQNVIWNEQLIPGSADQPSVRTLLYQPSDAGKQKRPGLFHIHGGGFVMGVPELNSLRDVAAVEHHDCIVLSPAYRLAPEAKFPAPLEDLYTSLKWFHDQAEVLGMDPDNIIVIGESAGGGLAAALAMLVRDRGEISIAGQILFYPMIDDRTGTVHDRGKYAGAFVWTAEMNRFAWESFLPGAPGSADVSSLAAPARSTDLSGLPPTIILTGALDLFATENLDYAKRLAEAGVPMGFHLYPGACHIFDLAGATRVGMWFAEDVDKALRSLMRREIGRHDLEDH